MARRTVVLVGVLALGVSGAAAGTGTGGATAARCGPPDAAPGFETPAQPGVVPDVECMDYQLAQDKLQAADFGRIRTRDAAGANRYPNVDRDWVVVAQDPPPGTRKGDFSVTLDILHYGDRDAPPAPDRTRPSPVPLLDCFDLQEANDTLLSAGFRRLESEDASGGRNQWRDRNWTVVGQRPAAGTTYAKDRTVTLEVMKDEESTGC